MIEQPTPPDMRQIGAPEEDTQGRYKPYYVNSWAAIIGINNYPYLSKPLTYAVADAAGVADLLVTRLDFPRENVFVILDPLPLPGSQSYLQSYQPFSGIATKAAIEELLLTLLPEKAQIDDRVFVFFAGHGQRRSLANNAAKGYLMPTDAEPGAWHKWIEIDSILDSNLYNSKHVFYVLDACYSGLAATRSPETAARYQQDLITHRARQVLTAGKDDQVVADMGGEGHSIFTHYVLQGLNGEARQKDTSVITAFDLMRYVTKQVGQDTNSAQTPDEGTRLGHGGGDFIFRLPEDLKTALSPQEHLQLGCGLYELGQNLDDRGRYASARQQFETAIHQEGLSEEELQAARVWIAKTFIAENDLDQAFTQLSQTVEHATASLSPDALLNLAVVRSKRRETVEATRIIERFVTEFPEHPNAVWAKEFQTSLQSGSSGRRLALLVGTDRHPGLGVDLRGCVDDVKAFKEVLLTIFGFKGEEVHLLTDEQATRASIMEGLATLAKTAGPNDTVVFFRSGYATHLMEGLQRVEVMPAFDTTWAGNWIKASDLHEVLVKISAQHKWVILDAGGAELVDTVKRSGLYNLYINASYGKMTGQVLAGGTRAGAFTWAMTRELRNCDPARITHGELLERTTATLEAGGYRQTPLFIANPVERVLPPRATSEVYAAAWDFGERRNYAAIDVPQLRTTYEYIGRDRISHFFPAARSFGRAFLEKRDYTNAIEMLSLAASLQQKDPDIAFYLGQAQLASRDYSAAASSFKLHLSEERSATRREKLEELVSLANSLAASRRYALLVGVSRHKDPNYGAVEGAENDVELVRRVLTESCKFKASDVKVMLNEQATRREILAALHELASCGVEHTGLFYFAGNGMMQDGQAAILSYDARSEDVPGITLAELKTQVPEVSNLVTIVDAGWYVAEKQGSVSRVAHSVSAVPARSAFGQGVGGAATVESRVGSITILAQDPRASLARRNVVFESSRTSPFDRKQAVIYGNLTFQLMRVLLKTNPVLLTYATWVHLASSSRLVVKPVLYGSQTDSSVFSNQVLSYRAHQMVEEIDTMRYDESVAFLRKLITQRERQGEDYPEGSFNLGLFHGVQHQMLKAKFRLQEAENSLQEWRGVDETERDLLLRQVYYHTGRLLYEAKEELGTAVDKLKRAAEEADDDPRLQYYLGQSLRALADRENLKDAADSLQKYLEAGAPLGHADEVRNFLRSFEQKG